MNRTIQWLLAGGALLAAAGGGVVSYERTRDQLAVIDACQATEIGDWTTALAKTHGRVGADPTGRAAGECRCLALLAMGRAEECGALVSEILGQPEAAGWAPNATLAIHLIQTWRDEGRSREAAELARRAGARPGATPRPAPPAPPRVAGRAPTPSGRRTGSLPASHVVAPARRTGTPPESNVQAPTGST